MSANEIHVGDIGTVIQLTVKEDGTALDISGTTVTLLFTRPDDTLVSKSGSFVTDGSDGKVQYTTVSGFLSLQGIWRVQAHVDFSSTEFYSDIQEFKVYPNLGVI